MKNDLEIHGGEVSRRSEFFFWAFAVLALFLFLGHNALWASEERWAEVAREMLLSGDWLHPSLNWVIYFDKPQLSYWLILPFAVLLGGMDELVVRIREIADIFECFLHGEPSENFTIDLENDEIRVP